MHIDGDGVVVVDWFRPGGAAACTLALQYATYAVALDLDVVGPPPFTVAFRSGPRQSPDGHRLVAAGTFAPTTTLGAGDAATPAPTTTEVRPVPPTAAPVAGEVAAGTESIPRFGARAGALAGPAAGSGDGGGIGFDVPVPPEWEAEVGPRAVIMNVTGRGGLTVETFDVDDPRWTALVNPAADMEITSGPTALATPTYRQSDSGQMETTGEALVTHEYRFASTTSFLHQTVRWYERGDQVTVAVLGYPDPEKVPESLTGLTPEELLGDIRFTG